MPIIYLSGPMSGLPEHNLPAFLAAEAQLVRAGFVVISPAKVTEQWGQQQAWRWYMREAIRALASADCVAMLPGWQASKGATLEREIALGLHLPVLRLAEWVQRGPMLLRQVIEQMGGGHTAPDFETERATALALRG